MDDICYNTINFLQTKRSNKMKGTKIILTFAAAMIMSGCAGGGTFDLSANPSEIARTQGVDAAIKWCDNRDADLQAIAGVKHIADVAGFAFDIGAAVAQIPVVALSGKPFIDSTTALRNSDCAALRKEGEQDGG